jgi:hypothetical protein
MKPRPNDMIRVPACYNCNNKSSSLDEEFGAFVCANATVGRDDVRSQFYKQKVLAPLRHNRRLTRQILNEAKKVDLFSKSGIYLGYAYAIKWRAKPHTEVIKRITKGLYFYHFNEILSPDTEIKAYWLNSFGPKLKAYASTLKQASIGGESFIYCYGRSEESPQTSIWLYQFHMSHFAGASTG